VASAKRKPSLPIAADTNIEQSKTSQTGNAEIISRHQFGRDNGGMERPSFFIVLLYTPRLEALLILASV
jgi:hypothetical protein